MVNSIWGLSCLKNLFHDRFAALLSSTGAYNCVKCSEGMKCPALSSLVACLQTPTGGVDLLCWQSPQLVFDLLGVFQPNISKTVRRVVGTLPWFLNSLACLLFLATVHHQLESGKQPTGGWRTPPLCGFFKGPGETPVFKPPLRSIWSEVKVMLVQILLQRSWQVTIPLEIHRPRLGEKKCPVQWMDGWMDGWKLGI